MHSFPFQLNLSVSDVSSGIPRVVRRLFEADTGGNDYACRTKLVLAMGEVKQASTS